MQALAARPGQSLGILGCLAPIFAVRLHRGKSSGKLDEDCRLDTLTKFRTPSTATHPFAKGEWEVAVSAGRHTRGGLGGCRHWLPAHTAATTGSCWRSSGPRLT